MTIHNFADSLALSKSYADAPWWGEVYGSYFGNRIASMMYVHDDGWAQRGGIDRLVTLTDGTTIKVDEKVRSRDFDDFALEVWSNDAKHTPGWMEKSLTTDFIAYAFVPSRRCYLLPYQPLKRAYETHKRQWHHAYGFIFGRNRGYVTSCIPVPICEVERALTEIALVRWSEPA